MAAAPPRFRAPEGPLAAGMAIAFALTFLLRFLTLVFSNDHFTHLSRAHQILLGEWPIRDFFDPGQFLHYYASAAAQLAFGHTLFGEALLTCGAMALGAALTYGVSTRLTGRRTLGACAAACAALTLPRLYNYPKVVLYVAAIWLAWQYAQTPGRRRAGVLAAFTMLSFLFRYDHGIYIGSTMVLLLTLRHWGQPREWRGATAAYLVTGCLLFLPFAVYVQWAVGVPEYVEASVASARMVRNGVRRALNVPVTIASPTSAGTNAGASANPIVERATSYLTQENALAWLTAVTFTMPLMALLMAAWAWWRGRVTRPEGAVVVATACLGLVIARALIDNNPNARLGDIAPVTAVLGAWMAGRWLVAPSTMVGAWARRAGQLVLLSFFVVTFWSVVVQASVVGRLRSADLHRGPDAIWGRLVWMYQRLHLRPIDDWAPPSEDRGIEALGRYVLRCTAPTDRLLVTGGFAPEIYYYAERAFAGGQVHFITRWHETEAEQRLTIERLSHQSVPLVFVGDNQAAFTRRFSMVARYIQSRYMEVPFALGGDQQWRVFVERARPVAGIDSELQLPCFRPAQSR